MTHAQVIMLYRPLLQRLADHIVRCKADAEDLVQDTFLKWMSVDTRRIENTKAYLVRAVINNSLKHLKQLEKKRESYFDGLKFPDITLSMKGMDLSHLDAKMNITAALHTLQSRLKPLERAVYILKEAFSFDYEELQDVLKQKQAHCRQLFSRAKKKLEQTTRQLQVDSQFDRDWQRSFKKACDVGFLNDLIQDLKRDIKSA